MKKILVAIIMSLMVSLYAATCFAFPTPGTYVSANKTCPEGSPLMFLYVYEADNGYYGKLRINGKGYVDSDWSVPFDIPKDSNGRYVFKATYTMYSADRKKIIMQTIRTVQIDEIADGSFVLYEQPEVNGKKYSQVYDTMVKSE